MSMQNNYWAQMERERDAYAAAAAPELNHACTPGRKQYVLDMLADLDKTQRIYDDLMRCYLRPSIICLLDNDDICALSGASTIVYSELHSLVQAITAVGGLLLIGGKR